MNNSIPDENNIHDSQYVTLDIGDEFDAGLELLPGESIMPRKADIEIAEENGKLFASVYYPYERLTAIMSKQKFWLSTSARAATGTKTLANLRKHKENLEKVAEVLIRKFAKAFLSETEKSAGKIIKQKVIPRKIITQALGENKAKVTNTMASIVWVKTPYAGMFALGDFLTDARVNEKRKRIKCKINEIIKKSKIPFPYNVSEILSKTKRKSAITRNVINEIVEEKRYEELKEHIKWCIKRDGDRLKIDKDALEKLLRHKFQTGCKDITAKMLKPSINKVLVDEYEQVAKKLLEDLEDGNKSEVAEKIIFIFRQISKLRPRPLKLTTKKRKKGKKGLRPLIQFLYLVSPHHRDIEKYLKPLFIKKPRLLYSARKRRR